MSNEIIDLSDYKATRDYVAEALDAWHQEMPAEQRAEELFERFKTLPIDERAGVLRVLGRKERPEVVGHLSCLIIETGLFVPPLR